MCSVRCGSGAPGYQHALRSRAYGVLAESTRPLLARGGHAEPSRAARGEQGKGMALLNAGMLLGALFVAVPIVLHLTMRPRPRKMIFPAVRFVLPRREANQRRLRW